MHREKETVMDIHKVSYLMMCKCNYSIEDGYAIRGNATYVRSVSSSLFSKEIRERWSFEYVRSMQIRCLWQLLETTLMFPLCYEKIIGWIALLIMNCTSFIIGRSVSRILMTEWKQILFEHSQWKGHQPR